MVKWQKQGLEMGREVVEPVDGVAQDTRGERRWMLGDWCAGVRSAHMQPVRPRTVLKSLSVSCSDN